MNPSNYQPPGIRRTVRAHTIGSTDNARGEMAENTEDGAHAPGLPGVQVRGRRADSDSAAAHLNPPLRSNLTGLRRTDTTESFTTSIGDDELESLGLNSQEQQSGYAPETVERFRRKLCFFFMNPYEKWKAKRRFPWKLVLQIAKVILATVQLTTFGFSRSSHVNFLEKSSIAFKHLYLKDWTPSYETLPYPPATGSYAIYTIPEFYKGVNYAMEQYDLTEKLAVGTFRFQRKDGIRENMTLCNTHYKMGKIYGKDNTSYDYDSDKIIDCYDIGPLIDPNTGKKEYDVKALLASIPNATINFDTVIRLEVKLSLLTVHLKTLAKRDKPDCYEFLITITYENSEHDGQMLITLTATEVPLRCQGHVAYPTDEETLVVVGSIFDTVVIFVSMASMVLCIRSIIRAQKLRKETIKFFKRQYDVDLEYTDRMEFVDLWYVLIIINDILTIIGSVVKIMIENKISNSYELCGAMLGTGSLLVWFGVLRYLGFFGKYNVLILTLKKSAPNVLRFLLCAMVFYLGFTFCGWVVLGPYHMKFREISTASECLFSLVNGDDMFVTFSIIGNNNNGYVWYYSRLYLYLFIALFIYVVLSVFISVIMDAYETIKYYYENGFPKSTLMKFVEECPDDSTSPIYRTEDRAERQDSWEAFKSLGCFGKLNCCKSETVPSYCPQKSTSPLSTGRLAQSRRQYRRIRLWRASSMTSTPTNWSRGRNRNDGERDNMIKTRKFEVVVEEEPNENTSLLHS